MTVFSHKKRARVAAVVASALVVLGGCATGESAGGGSAGSGAGSGAGAVDAGSEAAKGEVRVAMTKESENPGGFDPVRGWGCGEHAHEPLIQSTLVTTDEKMGFTKDLATDYSMAPDGKSWNFTIRQDARFSDGTPLRASDVAFTINQVINAPDAVCELQGAQKATAPDDTHVTIAMATPNISILYTLAVLGIVPQNSYGKDYGSHPIGSGRYILERWDPGQQAIFTANPTYYGPKPKMKRLVVTFMEEDPAIAAARSGNVDVAYVYAPKSGQTISGYSLADYATVDSRGISLPVGKSGGEHTKGADGRTYPAGNDVTSDIAIRRALNYAVDRDEMVHAVLKGHGTPAYSVSDKMPWATNKLAVQRDVAKAEKILSEGGWKPGPDGIREKNGTRAEFNLLYFASDSTRQALALDFANQMRQIGISVRPEGLSHDEVFQHQYTDPVLWGWGSNSPIQLYELLRSDALGNFPLYTSGWVDTHVDRAIGAASMEDSFRNYRQAQEGPEGVGPDGGASWVWLVNVDHLYFVRDGLHIAAQKPHPHGHGWSIVNNVDQWYWK